MSRPSSANEQTTAARPTVVAEAVARDWFLPAIECNGTVSESLSAVLGELDQRTRFIASLKACLDLNDERGIDAVTDLSQRIRSLENTLKFRLGILRPERPQAWFRAPAATSTGPFAATLIDEPVFAHYDAGDAERVKRELYTLWGQRRAKTLPFKDDSPCLWKTLLQFGAELRQISELPAPFLGMKLEELPESLPAHLDSRALRAFLLNVRNEVLGARERLEACFRQLRDACERFWTYQREHEKSSRPFAAQQASHHNHKHSHAQGPAQQASGYGQSGRSHTQAESMREEFRRRRQTTQPVLRPLNGADLEALRFMGFDDVPAPEILRQRYIILAKQFHPDRHGGNENSFKRLSSAYSHLINRFELTK